MWKGYIKVASLQGNDGFFMSIEKNAKKEFH